MKTILFFVYLSCAVYANEPLKTQDAVRNLLTFTVEGYGKEFFTVDCADVEFSISSHDKLAVNAKKSHDKLLLSVKED